MSLLLLWAGAGPQAAPVVPPQQIGSSPAGGGWRMHEEYLRQDDERIMELLAALLDD